MQSGYLPGYLPAKFDRKLKLVNTLGIYLWVFTSRSQGFYYNPILVSYSVVRDMMFISICNRVYYGVHGW